MEKKDGLSPLLSVAPAPTAAAANKHGASSQAEYNLAPSPVHGSQAAAIKPRPAKSRLPKQHAGRAKRNQQIVRKQPMAASHNVAMARTAPKLAITSKSSTSGAAPVQERKAPPKAFSTLATKEDHGKSKPAPTPICALQASQGGESAIEDHSRLLLASTLSISTASSIRSESAPSVPSSIRGDSAAPSVLDFISSEMAMLSTASMVSSIGVDSASCNDMSDTSLLDSSASDVIGSQALSVGDLTENETSGGEEETGDENEYISDVGKDFSDVDAELPTRSAVLDDEPSDVAVDEDATGAIGVDVTPGGISTAGPAEPGTSADRGESVPAPLHETSADRGSRTRIASSYPFHNPLETKFDVHGKSMDVVIAHGHFVSESELFKRNATIAKASQKASIQKEFDALKKKMKAIGARKDVLKVTGRRAPPHFKELSAVRKLQPKAKHAHDESSVHYFCHARQVTGQLPLPLMVASLLSHPHEPQVMWHQPKAKPLAEPTTKKPSAPGSRPLSMAESTGVLRPLLDRVDKELKASAEWLPKKIMKQVANGGTTEELKSEAGKKEAAPPSREQRAGESADKVPAERRREGSPSGVLPQPQAKQWKDPTVPKHMAERQVPARLLLKPEVIQKNLCSGYDPADGHKIVLKMTREKEERAAAALLEKKLRDADIWHTPKETEFRSRMYKRRSYSICDLNVSFFDSLQMAAARPAAPASAKSIRSRSSVASRSSLNPTKVHGDGAGIGKRVRVHPTSMLHYEEPEILTPRYYRPLRFQIQAKPALRKWSSCPHLSADTSTVLTMDTSYSTTLAEVTVLQEGLNKAYADELSASDDDDDVELLSPSSSFYDLNMDELASLCRGSAQWSVGDTGKAAKSMKTKRSVNMPSHSDVRELKRKMTRPAWSLIEHTVRALRQGPDKTMTRRKSLPRLHSMVTEDGTMETLGIVDEAPKRNRSAKQRKDKPGSPEQAPPVIEKAVLSSVLGKIDKCHSRSLSLPRRVPTLKKLRNCTDLRPGQGDYEWAVEQWGEWYDDYLREYQDENSSEGGGTLVGPLRLTDPKNLRDLCVVPPVVTDAATLALIREEIAELQLITADVTADDSSGSTVRAIACCRQAALLMKLGELKEAFMGITRALAYCPDLLDAYWYRHLLQLLQNQEADALSDLNVLISQNETSVKAYRARGDLKFRQGKLREAILNYTTAISLAPQDPDLFFQRAHMYEETDEMGFAMADYASVVRLQPSNSDALWRRSIYLFTNGHYRACMPDLTILVEQTNDKKAYLYRGQVHNELRQHVEAVKDFSAAIALDPDSALAYYHRGCILMKCHGDRALKDFSIALLLDVNCMVAAEALLHRGVLYALRGSFNEAVRDFQNAIAADPQAASAHICLGLVWMNEFSNYRYAMQCMDAAIRCNQMYDRAYACRAHLHRTIGEDDAAVTDYSKAIRLQPCTPQYWLFRGRLLLSLNRQKLAHSDIRTAALLVAGMDATPVQKSVVNIFLGEEEKAIGILQDAQCLGPNYSVSFELGKALMNTGQFHLAMASFKRALTIKENLAEPSPKKRTPVVQGMPARTRTDKRYTPEMAECHFLIGKCHMGLQRQDLAVQSFNTSLKYNDKNAKVYYERGVAYIPRNERRALSDLYKSISLSKDMYEAYMTRAVLFGARNSPEVAIINCNNAIRLRPRSVRAHLYRAMLQYECKRLEEAVCDLSHCLHLDATCALALYNRGIVHTALGNTHHALRDYSAVLLLSDENNPDYRDLTVCAYMNRSAVYYDQGSYECALSDFQQLLMLECSDLSVYHGISMALMRCGYLGQAVDGFTYVLAANPRLVETCLSRGACFWEYCHPAGDAMAMRDISRAIMLDPLCTKAYVDLGLCLQMKGYYQQAWYQFTKALAIDPQCTRSREARAILNLQLREFDAALQDINTALKVVKSAGLLTTRAVVNLYMKNSRLAMHDLEAAMAADCKSFLAFFNAGCLAAQQRHYVKALDWLTTAVKLCPEDYSALNNRAVLAAISKDLQGAENDLNTAASLCPTAAFVHLNRGHLLKKMNNVDSAVDAFSEAIDADPYCLPALKARVTCYEEMGQSENALTDFRHILELEKNE